MADDRSTSFPFAGLAVVALFLTTTFLGPQGFELLRQAETDTAKRPHRAEPPVDARLWEDPLAALARYRERCADSGSTAAPRTGPGCRPPADANGLKEFFGETSEWPDRHRRNAARRRPGRRLRKRGGVRAMPCSPA